MASFSLSSLTFGNCNLIFEFSLSSLLINSKECSLMLLVRGSTPYTPTSTSTKNSKDPLCYNVFLNPSGVILLVRTSVYFQMILGIETLYATSCNSVSTEQEVS